jgi:copper chaperone CopZ
MYCSHCAKGIENKLNAFVGVAIKVSYPRGIGHLKMTDKVNMDSLILNIEAKGYQVMKVEEQSTISNRLQALIQYFSIEKFVQSIDQDKLKDWLDYARQRDIVLCALKMAAIVGTILMLINHGEELFFSTLTTLDWVQIGLTYLVPYCVSTYSSVETARRHREQP